MCVWSEMCPVGIGVEVMGTVTAKVLLKSSLGMSA